ncbi:hypothetical protein [Adlercreutzia sp. ZJ138]|uniref:hypothetical protein n=1 Tax=Adlercreutzia sp. ZJ138 TaxID=2709405 RepID=UPI0013ECB1F5|nr:hypothetical protein [Adlercreutzia sp. ZJ138]
MKPALRFLADAAGVFVALMVSGLVTRPVALAFPVPALHGLLMALPAAFLMTFALGRGVSVWACGVGVAAFALMLGMMSPVMGLTPLVPLLAALILYGCAQRLSSETRCMGAGILAGTLYFPFTLVCSGSRVGFAALAGASSIVLVVMLTLLGIALAALGAMLASIINEKKG